jgi:hypothetical protein
MSTVKTLTLAAFAALSLGVGSAMAQEGPTAPDNQPFPGMQQQRNWASPAGQVQSGSSDVNRYGTQSSPASTLDYGDLANPG